MPNALTVETDPLPLKGWLSFRYLELNSRIRKEIKHPKRERVLVRIALKRIGLLYRELIPFYNPLYCGWRNTTPGSIMWLDFVSYDKTIGMFAIQFELYRRTGGAKKNEKIAYQAKLDYIKKKNIPILLLSRKSTSQEYEMLIRMFLQKERRSYAFNPYI